MTLWKITMLALLLPLVYEVMRRLGPSWRVLWSPKIRTWLIMMSASLLSYVSTTLYGYLVLDIILNIIAARVIVIAPKSNWQRSMAALFLAMAVYSCGFTTVIWLQDVGVLIGSPPDIEVLRSRLTELGWGQTILLCLWGGYDLFGRRVLDRIIPVHRRSVQQARIR